MILFGKTVSSTLDGHLRVTISGGSHEPEMTVVMEGFPAEITGAIADGSFDMQALQAFLARRAPGGDPLTTSRSEADIPELRSLDPLTFVIRNTDARSEDYEDYTDTPRPGHADYPAAVKYGGRVEMAGGGPFSGRMTAPLCVAGGIALQWLAQKGISVQARLAAAGGVVNEMDAAGSRGISPAVLDVIAAAKNAGDSVGGVVACEIDGLPVGLGGPLFDGLESRLAPVLFAIPGVKGVAFGDGFTAAAAKGSETNDAFAVEDDRIVTKTNHAGGILGGMADGMPVTLEVAFKPTPSIAQPQETIDLRTREPATISVGGRHDPCIALRAVPVVEAACALGILDAMLAEQE